MVQSDGELVSVVVPAFNAERTIGETLLSVRRQTYRNLDIIVVDDGSTDRTSEIVHDQSRSDGRIRIIRQPNNGVAAARNTGIAAARAELIATIDADDVWQPSKIARQVEALEEYGPQAKLVYAWSAFIDETGQVVNWGARPNFYGDVFSELCRGNFVGNGSAALIRKSVLERLGGYDSSLRGRGGQGCEDWGLFLRIAEVGHFVVVPDHLTGYRQLQGAMSRDVEQMLRSDELIRSEVLVRRPEYTKAIRSGRLEFIDWMFRRELEQNNWPTSFSLLRRLFLEETTRASIPWRTFRCAAYMAVQLLKTKPSTSTGGPQFLSNQ